MDTLKKIIHPYKSHEATSTSSSSSELPPTARPNAETTAALGSEPNITGTDRPAPKDEFPENINHGHEHEHEHHHTHQHNYNDVPTTHNHADKQPRLGHHHPRQPVGATGLPPNHQPRENFTNTTGAGGTDGQTHHHHHHQQEQQQPPLGLTGADTGVGAHARGEQGSGGAGGGGGFDEKITRAEAGNNFPGTNPHPAHSALGNRDASGETGMLMPGQE